MVLIQIRLELFGVSWLGVLDSVASEDPCSSDSEPALQPRPPATKFPIGWNPNAHLGSVPLRKFPFAGSQFKCGAHAAELSSWWRAEKRFSSIRIFQTIARSVPAWHLALSGHLTIKKEMKVV